MRGELPFLDNSFSIVISRLAFHHFPDVNRPFSEMARVLKSGGKFVFIDMEATEENLRTTQDKIETLRDPSHIRNLSQAEMLKLYSDNLQNGYIVLFAIIRQETKLEKIKY